MNNANSQKSFLRYVIICLYELSLPKTSLLASMGYVPENNYTPTPNRILAPLTTVYAPEPNLGQPNLHQGMPPPSHMAMTSPPDRVGNGVIDMLNLDGNQSWLMDEPAERSQNQEFDWLGEYNDNQVFHPDQLFRE
jgi:hypothetical protein